MVSWEREVLDTTTEDLARRNSPALLALLLQQSAQRLLDTYAQHSEEMERVKDQLTAAERIGIQAQHLAARGRKSVRLSDLGL